MQTFCHKQAAVFAGKSTQTYGQKQAAIVVIEAWVKVCKPQVGTREQHLCWKPEKKYARLWPKESSSFMIETWGKVCNPLAGAR